MTPLCVHFLFAIVSGYNELLISNSIRMRLRTPIFWGSMPPDPPTALQIFLLYSYSPDNVHQRNAKVITIIATFTHACIICMSKQYHDL